MTTPPALRARAAMPYDGVALRLGGGRVLLGPAAVLTVAAALDAAHRAAHRDGIAAPATFSDLAATVAAEVPAARASVAGRAEVPPAVELPAWGPELSTASAARLLGITDRGVRDLASRGSLVARKVGGVWLVDSTSVASYAAQRRGRSAVA